MTNQSSCVVFWNPCPFTLGDEPLAGLVEHCASEVRIGYSKFRIGLHNLVHTECWKQPALSWQGCIEQLLKNLIQWHLPFCGLGLQLSERIGLDPDEPSQVSLADDITCQQPTDLPRAHACQQAKKEGARKHPALGF